MCPMRAFLSYQTKDKLVAGRVGKLLEGLGISVFMAHEDIDVSEEWRIRILKELGEADLFVPILSKHYFLSIWCTQESGVAAFRNMTIVPLSIDGTIPDGFMGHIQSTKIDGERPAHDDIVPGLAKLDVVFLISCLIKLVAGTRSYRDAESACQRLQPYLSKATKEQKVELLTISTRNSQVCNAGWCAKTFLPPLSRSHGRFMKRNDRKELKETLARYGA